MIDKKIFDVLQGARHLHFVGVGGISMSSIAMFALERGYTVTGSDRTESDMTRRLEKSGIKIFYSHNAGNVVGCDAVVYTAAVTRENPEIAYAMASGIPLISRAQFLGYIMTGYENKIGVSGTHGKSTTSSMLTHIFMQAGKDPTVALGAELTELGGAYRLGAKNHFIYESCEYKDSFLSFYPDIAVILNVDHDHVDYFLTMEQMEHSFALSIESAHTVVCHAGDEHIERSLSAFNGRVLRYGFEEGLDYRAHGLTYNKGKGEFDILKGGEFLCHAALSVPGEHNVLDSLAAAATADICGVAAEHISLGLGSFTGAKRRFEKRGCVGGVDIYDDYAHHPSEIRATLQGAKNLGYNRVFCVFQPHTYSRTAELFDEFAHSFDDADVTVFADIYSAREVNTFGISSADLATAVTGGLYFDSTEKIADYLRETARDGDMILVMGAGDIIKLSGILTGENK